MKIVILIPVFNDFKSVSKLIEEIDINISEPISLNREAKKPYPESSIKTTIPIMNKSLLFFWFN